jgi:collagen type III alpha
MGEENRKKLQQEMNELNSSDQKRREDAQRRLENQAEEAMKKNGDKSEKKPTEKDLKDLAEKAKDLNSTDPAKQEAARKELDQKLGKENREKLEKEMNALNSKDPMERKAAEERLKKAAEEMAKQAKEKPPSKEDVEKFAKEAEKLASKDEKERQEAEKKFDEILGEEARKQLQKDMEDMKSGDQKRQQEAMKRMQNAMKNSGALDQKSKLGGSGRTDQEGKPIEDDPKNRLKTAELQLKTLKEAQKNQEAIKELGYTPEEYERFLKAYEERVKRLRDEVSEAATNPNKGPTGPTTLKVGEGSGGKKLETRSDGTSGVNAGGAGTAPPGYSDAQKRFAEEAAKLRKSNEKK